MAFTTPNTKRRPERKERHRQTAAASRARGRDLRAALEAEAVVFYQNGMPKVADPARKRACARSLALFATTYLPHVFTLPMSDGQRADFATMQRAIVDGGRYAFAAPRGDGKTSRVEAAILWAAMYGHRHCIIVVGADLGAAQEIVDSVKLELRTNEKLRQDFPVPCWAATLSEDVALKAKGWTWQGQSLFMRWGRGGLVLPVLDGADGSGCVIVPRGLTGRLRGMRLKVGKRAVRPDLYAIDDPQTDESATSPAQVETRERLILGAIMGSGGPATSIAAILPCTIIRHNDLAARMLDRKRHPDWQGAIRSLVTTWPTTQDTRWKEYHAMRRESPNEANVFYHEHREEMDAGAEMDWPERFVRGREESALQHAENLRCDLGEEVFEAEYQNAPREKAPSIYELTAELVLSKIHPGRKAGEIPAEGRLLVCGTDVNHYGLHSIITAFANDQTAWIIRYGRHDNNGAGIVPKLCPESTAKKLIFEALVRHGQDLAELEMTRNDQRVRPGLWLIDAGYFGDVVRRYIEGPGRAIGVPVMAARGFNFEKYRPDRKSRIGAPRENCHLTESAVVGRFIAFMTDGWREVSQRAWLGSPNAPGSLSLFEGRHRDLAEQVTREKLVEKLRGEYGFTWRWATAPGWHDYGDALTMCYVAAGWGGIGTTGNVGKTAPVKRYIERRRPVVALAPGLEQDAVDADWMRRGGQYRRMVLDKLSGK